MTELEIAQAIDAVLVFEGTSYTPGDVAAGDPPTKFGITNIELGAWRKLGRAATPDETKAMDEAEARAIYRANYIVGPGFDQIAHPAVSQMVIDYGVNSGVGTSAMCLQRAVGVETDGKVGPVTLAAVNAADPSTLLQKLVRARVSLLVRWILARPAARGAYVGVIDRAVSFLPSI